MSSVLEVLAWLVCVFIAFTAVCSTVSQAGPLHTDWLIYEAVGAGMATGFGLLAARRIVHHVGGSRPTTSGAIWVLVGVAVRVVVIMPALLLFIVAAASGFSARREGGGQRNLEQFEPTSVRLESV